MAHRTDAKRAAPYPKWDIVMRALAPNTAQPKRVRGGGVNSSKNNYNADAKKSALPKREQRYVYKNSIYPP